MAGSHRELVTAKAFVETYSGYADPWAVVEQYNEFLDLHASTDLGRHGLANRLDAPAGRIREWMNGSRPDCVRGLQRAEARGWVPLTAASDYFPAFNRAAARTLARGSLDEQYVPQFSADSPADLEALFASLDLEWHVYREDQGHRGTEYRPAEDGTVFGRVLAALGVPVGDTPVAGLPDYLDGVDDEHRRVFAAEIVAVRGSEWEWADIWMVTHRDRPESYLRALAELFRSLDEEATISVQEDGVQIPRDFAEELLSHRPP